jgi:hypothetical protein
MKLKIKTTFLFAHRGVDCREYTEGAVVETDDPDLVEVATREGWAVPADQPEGKARKGAPENKAKG